MRVKREIVRLQIVQQPTTASAALRRQNDDLMCGCHSALSGIHAGQAPLPTIASPRPRPATAKVFGHCIAHASQIRYNPTPMMIAPLIFSNVPAQRPNAKNPFSAPAKVPASTIGTPRPSA